MSGASRALASAARRGRLLACAAALVVGACAAPQAPSPSAGEDVAPSAPEAAPDDPGLGEATDPFAEQEPGLGAARDPFAEPSAGEAQPELGEAPDPFAAEGAPLGQPDLGEAPDPFAAERAAAPTPASPSFDPAAVETRLPPPGLEVHGRINLTLALLRGREPTETLRGPAAFELSSADLYAQWFPRHWFGVLAEVELESDLEGDRGEGEERDVEPDLELLVVELRPLLDERLRLRVGRAPLPFGLERRYYAPSRRELANRPAAFRRVFPASVSDVGAFLWWTAHLPTGWGTLFELEAALTAGLEGPDREDLPDPLRPDRNGEPQLTGRAALTLLDVDGDPVSPLPCAARLTLGASLLLGHWDPQARRRLRFVGYDAELVVGGPALGELGLRFELVQSAIELGPDALLGRTRHGRGYYAQVAYHLPLRRSLADEVFVAFRYGRADRDLRVAEAVDVERYHLGFGWVPVDGPLGKVMAKLGLEVSKGPGAVERALYLELGYAF
ncbi:MAG: hypothetical protein AB7N76_27555 [Planctomycetota bacterium]